MKKLIIDADSLCFHSENVKTEQEAIQFIEYKINAVKQVSKIDDVEFYLTIGRNIRYEVFPEYKANRVGGVRPEFMKFIKNYLIETYNAIYDEQYEADDLVVDRFNEDKENHVIASIDKDILKNTVGTHFNLYSMEYMTTTEEEAYDHFYKQLIIGDTIDGIPSLQKGIGEARIQKLLDISGFDAKELAHYMMQKKNIDFDVRYRLLYCGKQLPNYSKDIIPYNKSIDDMITFDNTSTKVSITSSKIKFKGKKTKTCKYSLESKIDFGKYKGKHTYKQLLTIDKSYLLWLERETTNKDMKEFLKNII